MDNLEKLADVLYNRDAHPNGWLGGSEATILKDAADEIVRLWTKVEQRADNSDYAPCAHEWFLIENEHVHGVDICVKCHEIKAHSA
jgi:hypothetical protein